MCVRVLLQRKKKSFTYPKLVLFVDNVHNVRPVARLEDVEGQIGVDAADQTNVRLAPQHRAGRRRRPPALAAPVPMLMGG